MNQNSRCLAPTSWSWSSSPFLVVRMPGFAGLLTTAQSVRESSQRAASFVATLHFYQFGLFFMAAASFMLFGYSPFELHAMLVLTDQWGYAVSQTIMLSTITSLHVQLGSSDIEVVGQLFTSALYFETVLRHHSDQSIAFAIRCMHLICGLMYVISSRKNHHLLFRIRYTCSCGYTGRQRQRRLPNLAV